MTPQEWQLLKRAATAAIQEQTNDHPVAQGMAAAALPAAAYYASSGGINEAGMNEAEKALASKMRTGSIARTVEPTDVHRGRFADVLNKINYGTKDIYQSIYDFNQRGGPEKHDVLIAPAQRHGPEALGKTQVIGGIPEDDTFKHVDRSKLEEYKFLHKNAPGSSGRAHPASKYMHGLPGSPEDRLTALMARLKESHPEGYVIKPNRDASSAGSIISHKDDLNKLYRYGHGLDPEFLAGLDQMSFAERIAAMKGDNELRKHMTVRSLLDKPTSLHVQENLNISPMSKIEQVADNLLTGRNMKEQEYRVHTLGRRALPAIPRYGPFSQLFDQLGFKSKRTKEVEQFANEQLARFPEKFTASRMMGMDIAHTPNGYKIVETNPSGYSGFLHSPSGSLGSTLNNQRVLSAIRGQKTPILRGLGAAAAGGAGLAALLAARRLRRKQQPQASA